MSLNLKYASAISVAAMSVTMLVSTGGSRANAQDRIVPDTGLTVQVDPSEISPPDRSANTRRNPLGDDVIVDGPPVTSLAVTNLPAPTVRSVPRQTEADEAATPTRTAPTLAALVASTPAPAAITAEMNCLAGAIYFEAKGESLAGQLAVGRVVVERSRSGRFPASYCGVVHQPSQFSFIRGGAMPAIPRESRAWATAIRVAQIAHEGSWKSPVEGALFFHATYVPPMTRRTMIARVDNQIFYR